MNSLYSHNCATIIATKSFCSRHLALTLQLGQNDRVRLPPFEIYTGDPALTNTPPLRLFLSCPLGTLLPPVLFVLQYTHRLLVFLIVKLF